MIRLRNTEANENELKKRDKKVIESIPRRRRWISKTVIYNRLSEEFGSQLESLPSNDVKQLIQAKNLQKREMQEPEEEKEEEKSYSRGQVEDKAIQPLNQVSIDFKVPTSTSSAIFTREERRRGSNDYDDSEG